MGINYYTELTQLEMIDIVEKCQEQNVFDNSIFPSISKNRWIHIGKSSAGWCFSLHVIPQLGINDLSDWVKFLKDRRIMNEYSEPITLDELIEQITERSFPRKPFTKNDFYSSEEEFLEKNNAQYDSNSSGLLRHKLGDFCIKHGKGSWDCLQGYFC